MTRTLTPEQGHGEPLPLAVSDLIADTCGELRMLDLTLAARLGFSRHSNIRNLIAERLDELDAYGPIVRVADEVGRILLRGEAKSDISFPPLKRGRGRPGSAYLLNRDQAVLVAILSRTPVAVTVRRQVIEAFNAYRALRPEPAAPLPPRVAAPAPAALVNPVGPNDLDLIQHAIGIIRQQHDRLVELEGRVAGLEKVRSAARPPATPPALAACQDDEVLDLFLSGCTRRVAGGRVQARVMFEAWLEWCRIAGVRACRQPTFARRLRARGFDNLKASVM